MRWRSSMSGISMAGAMAAALAAAAPAGAGTLYRWQTENGTIAFADDPKRIPERYRESAEEIRSEGGLDDYERFTPTDTAAQQKHEARLAERLDGLRAQSGVDDAADGVLVIEEPAEEHPLAGMALRSTREGVGRRLVNTPNGPRWRRTSRPQTVDAATPVLGITPDADSDEPVVVERVRARSRDSLTTRHVTVVRQGGRVLAVLKPDARQSSADFPSEEDFER